MEPRPRGVEIPVLEHTPTHGRYAGPGRFARGYLNNEIAKYALSLGRGLGGWRLLTRVMS